MSAWAGVVPAELAGEVAVARQSIELPPAVAADAGFEATLARLLARSPFAAAVCARYPELLAQLAETGRLARSNAPDEIGTLLAGEATPGLSEDEFLHRLRLFRHRELCLLYTSRCV